MAVSHHNEFDQASVRILEKLSHLGLSISLDEVITAVQKQEVVTFLYSGIRRFTRPSL